MWNQDWAAQAACRASQPDKLFVRGAEQNKAKQVCGACPVRTECLAEALDNAKARIAALEKQSQPRPRWSAR